MAIYYLDTSALVKRYASEKGSNWVVTLTAPSRGHDIFISRLTGPEIIAAVFRKMRMGELSGSEASQLAQTF